MKKKGKLAHEAISMTRKASMKSNRKAIPKGRSGLNGKSYDSTNTDKGRKPNTF